MVSQLCRKRDVCMAIMGFRPLSGFMVSQWYSTMEVFLCPFDVSVPCRGLWFLNLPKPSPKERRRTVFPSPVGVYGFSIKKSFQDFTCSKRKFPSPVGVYGFSIYAGWRKFGLRQGFRPLSGFMVSQWSVAYPRRNATLRFPSPVGVYGFSIVKDTPYIVWGSLFPSPVGVYGFSILWMAALAETRGSFPSPVGVYGFSIRQF